MKLAQSPLPLLLVPCMSFPGSKTVDNPGLILSMLRIHLDDAKFAHVFSSCQLVQQWFGE